MKPLDLCNSFRELSDVIDAGLGDLDYKYYRYVPLFLLNIHQSFVVRNVAAEDSEKCTRPATCLFGHLSLPSDGLTASCPLCFIIVVLIQYLPSSLQQYADTSR